MPITINGSGTITGASTLATTVASPTFTTPNINSAQFATVSGTAPLYACRAWVNFNGTGTVAIRASGNVSSITDNGTGLYTVNFTAAMPSADYAACLSGRVGSGVPTFRATAVSTSAMSAITWDNSTLTDANEVFVAVFR
jgi:hypothetical protein